MTEIKESPTDARAGRRAPWTSRVLIVSLIATVAALIVVALIW